MSLIYGFLLSWTGGFALCLSLAEMASMAPVASAQYHFVAMLTPSDASKLWSWVSGETQVPTTWGKRRPLTRFESRRMDHSLCLASECCKCWISYGHTDPGNDCA